VPSHFRDESNEFEPDGISDRLRAVIVIETVLFIFSQVN